VYWKENGRNQLIVLNSEKRYIGDKAEVLHAMKAEVASDVEMWNE